MKNNIQIKSQLIYSHIPNNLIIIMTNSQPFKFENYVAPKQYYQVYMVDAKTGDVVMTSKVFDSYTDSSSFLDSVKSNTNRDKYFFNISYLTNYPDYEHEAKTPPIIYKSIL